MIQRQMVGVSGKEEENRLLRREVSPDERDLGAPQAFQLHSSTHSQGSSEVEGMSVP